MKIFHTRKKYKKHKKHQTQTSNFYPFSVERTKNRCLCCFLFAYFCFVSLFLLVCVFVRLKFICKNRLEIVLITSSTYTTTVVYSEAGEASTMKPLAKGFKTAPC